METKLQLVIQNQSPALCHAAKLFFEDVCGFKLKIVQDLLVEDTTLTIEYNQTKSTNLLFLAQHNFTNIDIEPVSTILVEEVLFPFATSGNSILPFDPIALTWFLMLTPNEQLKKCSFDKYHRPENENSWLVKNKMHHYPLIDIAANLLINNLKEKQPTITFPVRKVFFEPTFDIDIAFAHKAKSFAIHGLGTASLALKGNMSELKNRVNVWRNVEVDPFDVFDELLDKLEESNLTAVFFAMTANRSKHDKNNHFKSKAYRNLLRRLSERHILGLHPGYLSAERPNLVSTEKARLEDILGNKVTHVRQHYLRQFLPEMWQTYIENGFTHDYSSGFANRGGYKVGTCIPYQAFDIISEKALPLTLHPFAMMDTAFWNYQKLKEQQVIEVTKVFKSHESKYSSSLSAVWHNYAMPQQSEELTVFKEQISILSKHD